MRRSQTLVQLLHIGLKPICRPLEGGICASSQSCLSASPSFPPLSSPHSFPVGHQLLLLPQFISPPLYVHHITLLLPLCSTRFLLLFPDSPAKSSIGCFYWPHKRSHQPSKAMLGKEGNSRHSPYILSCPYGISAAHKRQKREENGASPLGSTQLKLLAPLSLQKH